MKIFCISDTHGDTSFIEHVPNDVDLVIHAGDISNFGTDYEIEVSLMAMNTIGKPVMLCPGNHDMALEYDKDYINDLQDKYKNILIKSYTKVPVEYNGKVFHFTSQFPQYQNWAFGVDEDKLYKFLPSQDVDVIVCHCPPSHKNLSMFAYNDIEYDIGNKALTEYLEKANETIVISGHVHEASLGVATIGKSTCYNVAKNWIVIEI